MIQIKLDGESPPEDWLKESDRLTRKLIKLHEAGDIIARNKLIDDNAEHWGKLKDWLKDRSHGKCWFSEARDVYSHLDVEHFRPKKIAKALDGTERDGYWWLAFDYRNYRLCGNVGNRKKGGWFPLKDGSVSSSYDNPREDCEVAYLLDPTSPIDVALIVFDEEGMARPSATYPNSWDHQRADVTIERLKLNEHEALTEERKRIWQATSREIDCFLAECQRASKGCNPVAVEKAKQFARQLQARTDRDAELSSVAWQCVLFRNEPSVIRVCTRR